MVDVKVKRWEAAQAPDEQLLRQLYAEEGLQPYRWSNGPGDSYAAHTHTYHKVIYVVRGSITFGLPAYGEQIQMKVGDRLDLPANVMHDASVGSQGVVCLEAHRH